MITFNYESEFNLENESVYSNWIARIIESEEYLIGEINYIFCDDEYLHTINVQYLNHDTLTDIISFDYTEGKVIFWRYFISTERVHDNAIDFNVSFNEELKRVMVHGVLHYCGYKDKSDSDVQIMRQKEEEKSTCSTMEQ